VCVKKPCWKEGRMDGWVGGWMGGGESRVKDCLQQTKTDVIQSFSIKETYS